MNRKQRLAHAALRRRKKTVSTIRLGYDRPHDKNMMLTITGGRQMTDHGIRGAALLKKPEGTK